MTQKAFKKFLNTANYGRCLNDEPVFGFNLSDGSMTITGLSENRPENHSFQNFWKELTRSDKRSIYRTYLTCLQEGYKLV